METATTRSIDWKIEFCSFEFLRVVLYEIVTQCSGWFYDIRTIEGHVFHTYHEACAALGLLADHR